MTKKKKSKDEILSEKIFKQFEDKYGEGSLIMGNKPKSIESVSTGSIELDIALGVGGFPRGRVIEIFGKEMSAKTTLALHAIANAQKDGITCAFIDAEHALDVDYAKKIGVDFKRLLLSQPDSGDDALNIAEDLIQTGELGYIVIDSVSALVPKAELEREIGQELPGVQARMMSAACRKIVPLCAKFNTSLIFINQVRSKIGVIFGSKTTTSGGNALKFYSTIRIKMKVLKKLKNKENRFVASNMVAEILKNKLAPPYRKGEFVIKYGKGVDKWGDVLKFLILLGDVERQGGWYVFEGEKVQGRKKAKRYVSKKYNYNKVYSEIMKRMGERKEEEIEEEF